MQTSAFAAATTAALLALAAAPGAAEFRIEPHGFVVTHEVSVAAAPDQVWTELLRPARYWSADHSYSGDSSNFVMQPWPGGCFCEMLPPDGFVEHMRVTMVQPKGLLRLSGALGPLATEGLAGGMTWQLAPDGEGTKISLQYKAGGQTDFPLESIAPAVDGVLGEQIARLAALF